MKLNRPSSSRLQGIIDKLAAGLLVSLAVVLFGVLPRYQIIRSAGTIVIVPTNSPPYNPPPQVTSITPDRGPTYTSMRVTINGIGFAAMPNVKLGDTTLERVEIINASLLRATVPAGMQPGTYGLRVCNPDQQCGEFASAYTVYAYPVPIVQGISPNHGLSNIPNEVTISGVDLAPGVIITVGNVRLMNVHWARTTEVRGVIPPGLAPGVYDVLAQNPGTAQPGIFAQAYTVDNPVMDDLSAEEDDLWTLPISVRQGEKVRLGLNIHRLGGSDPVYATVAFYLGEPANAGVLLGRATSEPLQPGADVKAVSIEWDTAGLQKQARIFAVIDPDNTMAETNEMNNVVRRTIRILPPPRDEIPPHINHLIINDGAQTTSSPQIMLTIDATDTGGSGLRAMYFVEYVYNSNVRYWMPVQRSGWVDFQSTYAMTLTERGGAHYIHAWVSDGAGNVSHEAAIAHIVYTPAADSVAAKQVRLYQKRLTAGQHVTITLETLSGDADLYVWSPYPWQLWRSTNGGTATDQVAFDAPRTGTYAIEVVGYLDSQYHLTIDTGEGSTPAATISKARMAQDEKDVPEAPSLMNNSEPLVYVAVPNAPDNLTQVFLPMITFDPAPATPALIYHAYVPLVVFDVTEPVTP
jgi:hypothetical protein